MIHLTSLLPRLQEYAETADWLRFLMTALQFAVIFSLAGVILRLIFGKDSRLNRALSACLSILLMYLAAILIYLFLPVARDFLSPLPFLTVQQTRVTLWDLSALSEGLLYGSLLKLAFIAFLVNLLEALLPRGETFRRWWLWRTVTVLSVLTLYSLLCTWLEGAYPQVFTLWAKPMILGFWLAILLTAVLKLLLGVVLTVMNPIIGALYTFFFSNIFGRQFSKSILTTLILVALMGILNGLGFSQFSFSDSSFAAYGPTCLIILLTLYLFGRFL